MSGPGETLRDAAALIEEAAENTPDGDFGDETIAEFEDEYGEVPSVRDICRDLVSTTRELALIADVHAAGGRDESEVSYTAYGHSDDIIAVTGDVDVELYASYPTPTEAELPWGVTVTAEYDGEWSFEIEETPEWVEATVVPQDDVDPETYNDYTEVVWVVAQR